MSAFFSNKIVIDTYALSEISKHLFGSRRLRLHNPTSDYDFYFHINDLDKLGTSLFELKSKKLLVAEQTFNSYITSKPKYGEVFLLKALPTLGRNYVDVLLFSDTRDIAIMDKVLTTMSESKACSLLKYKEEGFKPNLNNYSTFPTETKKIVDIIKSGYI